MNIGAPPFIIFAACLAGFLTLLILSVAIVNLVDYQSRRIKEEASKKFPLGGSSRERKNLKNLTDRLPSSIFAFVCFILGLMLTSILFIIGKHFLFNLKLIEIIFFLFLSLILIYCCIFYFKFYFIFKSAIPYTLLSPNRTKSRNKNP